MAAAVAVAAVGVAGGPVDRGGSRGGRVGGVGRVVETLGEEVRLAVPSFRVGGGGRWAVDRPVVSTRYGFGEGGASSSECCVGRGGSRGDVRGAVDEGREGIAGGEAVPVGDAVWTCLGGGPNEEGSLRADSGRAIWGPCWLLSSPRPTKLFIWSFIVVPFFSGCHPRLRISL